LKNFHDIFASKTVIIISTKLSLIRQAKRIIVAHNGGVSEEGTHEELIDRGGLYENLWSIHTGKQGSGCIDIPEFPLGDIRNSLNLPARPYELV
jgi:energy-coupling factor transporter ATP-binding protein EcfA2